MITEEQKTKLKSLTPDFKSKKVSNEDKKIFVTELMKMVKENFQKIREEKNK